MFKQVNYLSDTFDLYTTLELLECKYNFNNLCCNDKIKNTKYLLLFVGSC